MGEFGAIVAIVGQIISVMIFFVLVDPLWRRNRRNRRPTPALAPGGRRLDGPRPFALDSPCPSCGEPGLVPPHLLGRIFPFDGHRMVERECLTCDYRWPEALEKISAPPAFTSVDRRLGIAGSLSVEQQLAEFDRQREFDRRRPMCATESGTFGLTGGMAVWINGDRVPFPPADVVRSRIDIVTVPAGQSWPHQVISGIPSTCPCPPIVPVGQRVVARVTVGPLVNRIREVDIEEV